MLISAFDIVLKNMPLIFANRFLSGNMNVIIAIAQHNKVGWPSLRM